MKPLEEGDERRLHPFGSQPFSLLCKGNSQQLPYPFYRRPLPTNNVTRSQERNKGKNNSTQSSTLLTAAMTLPISQPPAQSGTTLPGVRVQHRSWTPVLLCHHSHAKVSVNSGATFSRTVPGSTRACLNQHFSCTALGTQQVFD